MASIPARRRRLARTPRLQTMKIHAKMAKVTARKPGHLGHLDAFVAERDRISAVTDGDWHARPGCKP